MSFAAGAATFNSCNKAGSIVQFTEHLRKFPHDYNSLIWRSKAHSIVGNRQLALYDLQHAISVSSGVKRDVAEGEFVLLSTRNLEQFGCYTRRTVDRFKNEWRAWEQLGNYHSFKREEENATHCWETSLSLATKNHETKDPGICWIDYQIGKYRLQKGEIEAAKSYFSDAVESCETHTVSHIQLCECNIQQGNLLEAKEHFQIASKLNPELSSSHFENNSFDEYLLQKSVKSLSLERPLASRSRVKEVAGKNGIGSGGGGTRGGGDSSDDDEDVNAVWTRLRNEAPCIKRYRGNTYAQSKCGKFWYSKDTAGHGGAQFKRYDNTRSELRFKDSVDVKLKPLLGKHESRENQVIEKSGMVGVNRKKAIRN